MDTKERWTSTHIYFLNGPLSQWFTKKFYANLKFHEPRLIFNCAEQFMMASKARLFNDEDIFNQIMNAKHPRDQKALGRQVRNFDPIVWQANAEDIVFRGNYFRAIQDGVYRFILVDSGNRHIVEGNKNDSIWGVGLDWNDDAILDETNWRGQNLLGKAHMKVRHVLAEQLDFGLELPQDKY